MGGYKKMKVKNWSEYEGCLFGCREWGHFENGIFICESYKYGDFPIVWCTHDEKACDVDLEEWCCIKQDHDEE